jgi:hypothetical protein
VREARRQQPDAGRGGGGDRLQGTSSEMVISCAPLG